MIDKDEFYNIINEYTNEKVLLAVSGGIDSICLLHLAMQVGLDFVFAIIDHGLRPESSSEAETTLRMLQQYNLNGCIIKWEGVKPISNVHEKARNARYKLLSDYCIKNGIKIMFTAHNMDDQAETLIMRIMRGTGIKGLCGIPEVGEHNCIKVFRPLLSFSRKRIELTIKNTGWSWVEDPSNKKYTRGFIRNIINSCEDKELLIQRLSLLSKNATRTESYLSLQIEDFFKLYTFYDSDGALCVILDKFQSLHEEIGLRVLKVGLIMVSEHGHKEPRFNSLEKLYNEIALFKDGKIKKTLHKTVILCNIKKNTIKIMKETSS